MSDSYRIVSFAGPSLPKAYEPLIYTSWMRSVRNGNDYLINVKAGSYYPRYHDYIHSVLSDKSTEVRIAVLSDDQDVVLGYSVSRGTKLDFVFVQKNQRRHGIGSALTPDHVEEWTNPLTPFLEKV